MITGHSRSSLALAAFAGLACLTSPASAQQPTGPSTGRLSCTLSSPPAATVTTQKPMECRFRPRRGPLQQYTGVVRGFSMDLASIRSAAMAWRVFGPYARAPLGALTGQYSASGTGAGTSGHVLNGGEKNQVTLQPLPFQGHRGINVSTGVTALELTLVPPGKRR
ncbi:DUF992 domain-containing protein [Bosea sp. TAF32]|uniref:DUF992 domain-containing protein n=1 Tax=Bosea sp. TAF32 TaxID=3237482 RepID=UPI003F930D90